MNQTPEGKARDVIDGMLEKAGWVLQNLDELNPHAAPGVVVREYPTDTGPADYLLYVNGEPCGVIEAKREEEGHRLTIHEDQSSRYAKSTLKWTKDKKPLRFVFESTGTVTRFTDMGDPAPRSRQVFSFFQPETLCEWFVEDDSLRSRLSRLPELNPDGLRKCQITAVTNLEDSFKKAKPRALIQMATGSGKTFTAITFMYRLLKHADAKRILFLVDTKNLGKQAEEELMTFTPNDDNRKITELYNVQRLTTSVIDSSSDICISTIQRMYSILCKEELDEEAEELSPYERRISGKEKEVRYNPDVPPDYFDFIVIDECHRSIYKTWRQVLEYFDAFLIGLTATPDNRTYGFFHENVVSEYLHEDAVADGVNVGCDIFIIETKITNKGAFLRAEEVVGVRHKLTRKERWEQLDEDIVYEGKQLDRTVVNKSQIRTVIKSFKENLKTIFPGRTEIPKTLVFAKKDDHADDIVQIIREEFDEGNEFCKKITYKAKENPDETLASFRTEYYPRVAVTVNMIATGTDVKPIECLLFMRDVRSKNYFEQMKGRGTRTLQGDDLKKVTPSAPTNKTHFVIVDAVGVTKSLKTETRTLDTKPNVKVKDLIYEALNGNHDEEILESLAGKLSKIKQTMTPDDENEFTERTGGKEISEVIHDLLNACDGDKVRETAEEKYGLKPGEVVSEEQEQEVKKELCKKAVTGLSGKVSNFIETIHKTHEQIVDTVNRDSVVFAGWDDQAQERAAKMVNDFQQVILDHRDEITALRIFFNEPYRRREVTFTMLEEVMKVIESERPDLNPVAVWNSYARIEGVQVSSSIKKLTALISLIRRITALDKTLTPFDSTVNKNFQDWVFKKQAGALKFNKEQMEWLRMIKDHIASSHHIENDDFDLSPFDAQGGLGKMHQLFGDDMTIILQELNEALAA